MRFEFAAFALASLVLGFDCFKLPEEARKLIPACINKPAAPNVLTVKQPEKPVATPTVHDSDCRCELKTKHDKELLKEVRLNIFYRLFPFGSWQDNFPALVEVLRAEQKKPGFRDSLLTALFEYKALDNSPFKVLADHCSRVNAFYTDIPEVLKRTKAELFKLPDILYEHLVSKSVTGEELTQLQALCADKMKHNMTLKSGKYDWTIIKISQQADPAMLKRNFKFAQQILLYFTKHVKFAEAVAAIEKSLPIKAADVPPTQPKQNNPSPQIHPGVMPQQQPPTQKPDPQQPPSQNVSPQHPTHQQQPPQQPQNIPTKEQRQLIKAEKRAQTLKQIEGLEAHIGVMQQTVAQLKQSLV